MWWQGGAKRDGTPQQDRVRQRMYFGDDMTWTWEVLTLT